MEDTKKEGEHLFPIKREVDSMDDFEHLGHDSSPLQDLKPDKQTTAPGTIHKIDITPKAAVSHNTASSDFATNTLVSEKMNRHLLEDDFLNIRDGTDKLAEGDYSTDFNVDSKGSSLNFIEAEKIREPPKNNVEHFLDLEDNKEFPSEDEFEVNTLKNNPLIKPINQIHQDISHVPEEQFPRKTVSPESFSKDLEELQPQKPEIEKKPELEKIVRKPQETKLTQAKIAPPDAATMFCKIGLESTGTDVLPCTEGVNAAGMALAQRILENSTPPGCRLIEAEPISQTDAWFNPEKLNPKVESLIYWRDIKKSGPVFGGVLLVLLALTYFSLISVVAYLSLTCLGVTVAFRIYKNVVQAIQKTGDGHPFKEFLELDLSLPQDKVKEIIEVAIAHINGAVIELRRLFLVEDLVDSIKFGVLLWTLTYVGAWFNGMTLITLAWVALFTLPKVYEANKTQVDANLEIVRTKLAEITSKIKAAIPMGKKSEEKKEQ